VLLGNPGPGGNQRDDRPVHDPKRGYRGQSAPPEDVPRDANMRDMHGGHRRHRDPARLGGRRRSLGRLARPLGRRSRLLAARARNLALPGRGPRARVRRWTRRHRIPPTVLLARPTDEANRPCCR